MRWNIGVAFAGNSFIPRVGCHDTLWNRQIQLRPISRLFSCINLVLDQFSYQAILNPHHKGYD
jgi:hypothetical protein